MDRRPDGGPRPTRRCRPARDGLDLRRLRHVLDRYLDCELERLLLARVDDGHRPIADGAMNGELALDSGVGRLLNCGFGTADCGWRVAIANGRLRAAEKPGHFIERALGRRQPDP